MANQKPMDPEKTGELTSEQAHALLDILSHAEVYQEIRDFRSPTSLDHYGPPFTHEPGKPSDFPALQALVSNFLLKLPGFRDVPEDFWINQCAPIVRDLEKAELSETYDKGLIGIRKTLSTAISALIEYPVRGCFAGFQEPNSDDDKRQYNTSDPEDLQRAFRDLMYRAVYGNVIDELFQKAAETDKLSEHSSLIQAAHEYVIVNLASFMHYTLILSPKGQQLLTLIDHAHKLIPYTIIRQTLKIGNVASMINGMMKIVLAKMSVASVTNWMGLTKTEDDGQNLLQHVISQTLQWDIRDFKSRATKIEKEKDGPKKEQLDKIKAYLQKSREEHEGLREMSRQEKKSIVFIILSDAQVSTQLTTAQHRLAQEYLAIHLAVRDREEMIKVLCKSHPDHLTQGVRECVNAYEPIIRNVHDAVDLAETVGDLEKFINDMVKLSKIPNEAQRGRNSKAPLPIPTVGDFVQLLKKHQYCSHKFIHQCAKNGKPVTQMFHDYALEAVTNFRRPEGTSSTTSISTKRSDTSSGAGSLTEPLNDMMSSLNASTRTSILAILDTRAKYLDQLHAASAARLYAVVNSPHSNHPALATKPSSRASSRASSPAPGVISGSGADKAKAGVEVDPGPGAFLARWQALMDGTYITPAVAEGGEVRMGGKASVLKASRGGVGASDNAQKTESVEDEDEEDVFEDAREKVEAVDGMNKNGQKVKAPDVKLVVETFGAQFRELLAQRALKW